VTIPKHIRDRLGIKPGSTVEFEIGEDGRSRGDEPATPPGRTSQ
jgi:bifunctional DNA-binding transcriptional regulator/antitoxin component of YhaV-PrlF toxin-antitoxin module